MISFYYDPAAYCWDLLLPNGDYQVWNPYSHINTGWAKYDTDSMVYIKYHPKNRDELLILSIV